MLQLEREELSLSTIGPCEAYYFHTIERNDEQQYHKLYIIMSNILNIKSLDSWQHYSRVTTHIEIFTYWTYQWRLRTKQRTAWVVRNCWRPRRDTWHHQRSWRQCYELGDSRHEGCRPPGQSALAIQYYRHPAPTESDWHVMLPHPIDVSPSRWRKRKVYTALRCIRNTGINTGYHSEYSTALRDNG